MDKDVWDWLLSPAGQGITRAAALVLTAVAAFIAALAKSEASRAKDIAAHNARLIERHMDGHAPKPEQQSREN